MNKEEIDILYSFANDEDCRYVYDWQGFNYEEICPLIDKLIKENKKYKEVIDKINHYIEKQFRMYGLSMPIELGTHLDNILGILKEVSE